MENKNVNENLGSIKLEKIILYVATETYTDDKSTQTIGGLDYLIPAIDDLEPEFKLIGYQVKNLALIENEVING